MIEVTKAELEKIKAIQCITTERIMFVLLVMAKYYKKATYDISKKDILRYSKCHISNDRIDAELFKLNQIGYIKTHRVIGRTINILDDEGSETVLVVKDLNNMIHDYLNTCHLKGYIFCSRCGKKVRRTGCHHKFCNTCRIVEQREKTKKRVKKARENKNVTLLDPLEIKENV